MCNQQYLYGLKTSATLLTHTRLPSLSTLGKSVHPSPPFVTVHSCNPVLVIALANCAMHDVLSHIVSRHVAREQIRHTQHGSGPLFKLTAATAQQPTYMIQRSMDPYPRRTGLPCSVQLCLLRNQDPSTLLAMSFRMNTQRGGARVLDHRTT